MKKELNAVNNISKLYKEISIILRTARANAYKAVNFAMVTSYWSIGQVIVEDEQNGNERAEYGKAVLEGLSKKLTAEFGKGFDESNLRYMRLFYQTFKNCDTKKYGRSSQGCYVRVGSTCRSMTEEQINTIHNKYLALNSSF